MEELIEDTMTEYSQKAERRVCEKCFNTYNLTDVIYREICGYTLSKNDCVYMFNRDRIILCKNCNELLNNILNNLNDFFGFVVDIKKVNCEIIKQDP